MDRFDEILRALGRIEGEMIEIRKLNQRVSKLEMWQSWLKGGWAVLVAAYAYLLRGFYGK
jgi:hypothetical protein